MSQGENMHFTNWESQLRVFYKLISMKQIYLANCIMRAAHISKNSIV